jgi:predicted nucleotidyltransferase
MITGDRKGLIPTLKQVLNQDDRVVFAYLYGSTAECGALK